MSQRRFDYFESWAAVEGYTSMMGGHMDVVMIVRVYYLQCIRFGFFFKRMADLRNSHSREVAAATDV